MTLAIFLTICGASLEAKVPFIRNFRVHEVGEKQLIIASAQVVPAEMPQVLVALREKKPEAKNLYILDLREEAHGYKSKKIVHFPLTWKEESRLLQEKKIDLTEESAWQMLKTKEFALHYKRFPVTDHTQAPDEMVDEWQAFLGGLDPKRDVVHVHCAAGKGRTSQFLVVSHLFFSDKPNLEEALQSVRAAGGSDFFTHKRKGDKKRQEAFFKRQAFLKELGTYFAIPKGDRPSFVAWKKGATKVLPTGTPSPNGQAE